MLDGRRTHIKTHRSGVKADPISLYRLWAPLRHPLWLLSQSSLLDNLFGVFLYSGDSGQQMCQFVDASYHFLQRKQRVLGFKGHTPVHHISQV